MIELKKCSVEKHIKLCKKYNLHTISSTFYQDVSEVVLIDNVEVALISLSYFTIHNTNCSIDCFEVFEKRQGYGSRIIKYLIEKKGTIEIIPLENSKDFWISMGFRPYLAEIFTNL